MGSDVKTFEFGLGSALNLMYSPEAQSTYIGVNLVALTAFIYLTMRARSGSARRVLSQ